MNKDELKTQIMHATYFRDNEGKLRIKKVKEDAFLAEDEDGEVYELFYCDYIFNRQKFEIIK